MAYNDITGDAISTRFGSKEAQEKFDASFDAIFGAKPKKTNGGWQPPPLPLNEYPETGWGDSEERIENIGRNSNEGLHYENNN